MKAIISSIKIETSVPDLNDNTADLDRLLQGLSTSFAGNSSVSVPLARMTSVARQFREAGFKGYAMVKDVGNGFMVVGFSKDKPAVIAAMALDLGTTHLEATLVNLQNGNILSGGDLENAQIAFGADILSRIHHATAARRQYKTPDPGFQDPGLVELQDVIVGTVNELAADLALKAGVAVSDIMALSVSGNTTMAHLLLGLDPYTLCREPYTPLFNTVQCLTGEQLKLVINSDAAVFVMPSIGSYFGGDLISGIVASGMAESEKTTMLIDVGTNAEVVLGNREWLIACAGAAGPALEGGVARMGMRAGPGAVEYVDIDRETYRLEYRTIGDKPAIGICGSGLIDLVAALYLTRLIDIRGKFRDPDREKDPRCREFMARHLLGRDGTRYFDLTPESPLPPEDHVVLEQVDLDALIRSKAAMYSILRTLINQVGLSFEEIDEIIVAGAFGKHINPERAVTLGMLPDLPLSVYRAVGNSSLKGAEMILLDDKSRDLSREIISRITYVELNVNQEFMIRFSGARFIPHTDPSLFPSVPIFKE